MLRLEAGELNVTIRNEPTYTPNSAANVRTYDLEITLSADDQTRASHISSHHGVTITDAYGNHWSCILLVGGGVSSLHEHSVVLRPDCIYIACGDSICALSLPDLEVRWWRAVDAATCFGIYELQDGSGLISHGELSIARVRSDGAILWTAGGADIFSGPLTMFSDHVRVIDWNETAYCFSIADGRPLEVS